MASVCTVTQATIYIRNMFTQDSALDRISIKGEVFNCKYHISDHIHFTLKDGGSQIAAVMFAGQRRGLIFKLREGQEATVTDNVDVRERDGRYQPYAKEITREDRGDLFTRFERLRSELEDMGMFGDCYKQPIPKHTLKVRIVTASTGAAIRDIVNISARRSPYVQLALYPVLVQGERTKFSTIKGIGTLDRMGLDVTIMGRGGGSIEDLWVFNGEMMARAIFNSTTPIISAADHETDVTIADYVADLRTPTPPTTAELAVFDLSRLEEQIKLYSQVLDRSIERKVEKPAFRLEQGKIWLTLHSPERQLVDYKQRLADTEGQMKRIMKERLGSDKRRLTGTERCLSFLIEGSLKVGEHRLAPDAECLEALSPLKKFSAGYEFVTDTRGDAARTVAQAKPGDIVGISVKGGRVEAQTKHVSGSEG